MRTLRWFIAALAVFVLSACGAGAPAGSAGPSPTTMSDADVLTLGRQVAQCFRDNGIPNFPDPLIDNHHLILPNDAESKMQDQYPQQALEQAQRACQSLFDQLPESAIRGEGSSGDADTPGPADVDALRRWAQCVRENGFPEWPDPKSDGSFPLRGTPLEAEGKSDRLIQAAQACQQYWSGGITYS